MSGSAASRRRFLRSSGLALGALAGCLTAGDDGASTVTYTDGFEAGFAGWARAADVPEDPNDPGSPVGWTIDRSTERAASGSASLRYFLDGRQDDGTVWVVRPVTVDPGRAYDVEMQATAWSASESFNTLAHLVMYAGPNRPTTEGSFPEPGGTSSGAGVTRTGGLREALNQAAGWRDYGFTWRTAGVETGSVSIAVGISAVWETEMTYFVDDVAFTATPR